MHPLDVLWPAQILAVGRQQAARQQQRTELSQRANTEVCYSSPSLKPSVYHQDMLCCIHITASVQQALLEPDKPDPAYDSDMQDGTAFLTLLCLAQLKAYEQARTSADHAYSKSKALALQRLNSRNSQLLRTSVTGSPAATPPQPGSAAASAAPSTPEQADGRAPFPDDGEPSGPICMVVL